MTEEPFMKILEGRGEAIEALSNKVNEGKPFILITVEGDKVAHVINSGCTLSEMMVAHAALERSIDNRAAETIADLLAKLFDL